MKKPSGMRLLSGALAVFLSLTSFPMYAASPAAEQEVSSEDAYIVSEDTSKRGEFEKHYLLSDGSFAAVSYAEAVHYKNDEGKWEEVDNTLSLNASTNRIASANRDFEVSFARKAQSGNLISLSKNGTDFSWSLTANRSANGLRTLLTSSSSALQTASVIEPESGSLNTAAGISDAESFAAEGMMSRLRYTRLFDAAPEISADYTVFHNKIEEDIYIHSPTSVNSFSMNIETGGLTASLREDGSVEFLDGGGEMQFRVGAPYMEDASNEILKEIDVTVEQNGESCVITYTPDAEWLTSPDRVYPILLDPSVTTKEYNANITDTYVYEGSTADHSSEQKLFFGVKSGKIHRVYLKVNNLPSIDAGTPILSAKMTLSFWAGTSTGKTAEVYGAAGSWNPSTVTYANQPGYISSDRLLSYPFSSSNTTMTFDLTEDVARLYDDYYAGVNYGYVVKYADESQNSPDYNTFYATDATLSEKHPVMTVIYGYSLPSSLSEGGIYSLENAGSGSLATVHNGTDANYTNIYQYNTPTADRTASQKFKLERVSGTGGYRFRAMCSSNGTNRVIDIQRNGDYPYPESGGNAYLYTATAPKTQEWLIIGVGSDEFKIVLRNDMTLALTAYPSNANGTSSGKSSTSPGNIFLATYSESNAYQRWRFIDEDGSVVGYSYSNTALNGVYYINNTETGKYLHKDKALSTPDAASGLISNLGNTIRWKITHLGEGEYVIQPVDDLTKYLKTISSTGTWVIYGTLSETEDIPNEYRWKFRFLRFQNVSSSMYLYVYTNTLGEYSIGVTSNTSKPVEWRIVSTERYGNTSSYEKRELTSSFSISDMALTVGESKSPAVNKSPSKAIWAEPKDFTFSKNNAANYNGSVTINNTDHTIKGAVTGAVSIRATHKVTGLTCDFSIDVRALLEKQADYSLPEDIKEKLFTIRSLISQIQASDSSASDKSIMIGELELQEDLIRADYILTGDNYQSDYAQSVIPNFLNIIDNSIETVSDDLYRVVANRLLVLFGLEFSNLENNNNAYFLDIDCAYDEWTAESQSALNWYFNGTTSGNFFNRTGSQITPVLRTVQLIRNLQIYRYHHDMVKKFVANNVGGTTEVTIKEEIKKNEYKVFGRADIMKSHSGGTYVWEVKPNKPRYYGGKIGTIQLTEYIVKANNSNFVASKGTVIFETLFSAGMPVTPFNLTIPDFTDDDLTTCLKVTPSPYAESMAYENGLILYQEIDEPDGDLQTYDCTQTQLSLLNENATIVAPSTVKVGVRDLVYTMAFGVVEGVVIGICIISAPYMMPSVSEVLSGTATSGTVTAVTSAIAGGSVVVTPLSTYSIGMINNMAY